MLIIDLSFFFSITMCKLDHTVDLRLKCSCNLVSCNNESTKIVCERLSDLWSDRLAEFFYPQNVAVE